MKYLILGGSGFLGTLLVERLYKGNELTVVARNEGKLIALKEKFPTIDIIPGDISDSWTVASAFLSKPDGVFLLSAFKHVGMAEKEAMQCVKSNVIGTLKVLRASMEYKPKFVIITSTDKAAQVSGVYGATKLIDEKLFEEAERLNKDTKYRVVRYGNVIKSTGSFLTKWEEKMKNREEIILTDPNATRFFWSRDEAVNLIFECLEKAPDAKPWIPKKKAISMRKALSACQMKWGDASKVKVIGLQPGENLHETMGGGIFSNEVEQYSVEEFEKFL
jgi:UDP-N-acetylglucosamine 4,6-dehydratase/UDP-glucose 4-epimerase